MARSSTTRKGNGPGKGPGSGGWGGPAKGEGNSIFTPESARLAVSRRDDPEAQAVRDEMRSRMLNVLIGVAEAGESETARSLAADKVLDRIDGKALARQEITGAQGGPIEVTSARERIAGRIASLAARTGTPKGDS